MASTEATDAKTGTGGKAAGEGNDLAGLEAGLDALETVQTGRTPFRKTFVDKILPPVIAVLLVLVVWQILVWAKVVDSYKLPAPSEVWARYGTPGCRAPSTSTSGRASPADCWASCWRWRSVPRWVCWWRA